MTAKTSLPGWVRIVREPDQYPFDADRITKPSEAGEFFRKWWARFRALGAGRR